MNIAVVRPILASLFVASVVALGGGCIDNSTDDANATCQAGTPTKNVYGNTYYTSSVLPSGSCSITDSCIQTTQDPCTNTSNVAPVIDWSCSCASGTIWSCVKTGSQGSACPG